MPAILVNRVTPTLSANDHPYMNGAWTPNFDEYDAYDLPVIGEIPKDLDGVYIRNTENPVHDPIGTYHPFDGDGMLHAMHFRDGKAEYRNRFIRTKGFEAEAAASAFVDDANTARAPSYQVAHLRGGARRLFGLPAASLVAGVQNLFDRAYSPSLNVNAAGGKFYEPAVGRTVFVGLTIGFAVE